MVENVSKELRLSEFINVKDNRAVIVDTSMASSVGPSKGISDLDKGLRKVIHEVDAIVMNPGQVERLANLLTGKDTGTVIMRVDWTNAFRDQNFPITTYRAKYIGIATPEDGMRLGASTVIAYFLLGYDEDFETQNFSFVGQLARKCSEINLPLIVDIHAIGPKISKENFTSSILMEVSMLLEIGVDSLIIPYPGKEAMQTIQRFVSLPVFIREDKNFEKVLPEIKEAIREGAAGVMLGQKVFDLPQVKKVIQSINTVIH